MLEFLIPLLKTMGASGASGGLSGGAGLANILGGIGGDGSMAGSTMGGGMQGPTQGSGLLGILSGGTMGNDPRAVYGFGGQPQDLMMGARFNKKDSGNEKEEDKGMLKLMPSMGFQARYTPPSYR